MIPRHVHPMEQHLVNSLPPGTHLNGAFKTKSLVQSMTKTTASQPRAKWASGSMVRSQVGVSQRCSEQLFSRASWHLAIL